MTGAMGRSGVAGLAAGGILVALSLAFCGLDATARGWLACYAFASGVPLGSIALLMIHRLTGGAWGDALGPVLRPASLCVPAVALAFIPLAFTVGNIYSWVQAGGAAQAYLNTPAFLVRAAIALIGWSVLGVIFARGRGSVALAAFGLIFYVVSLSLVAIDWFMSVDPKYTSTTFGTITALQQILAALAFCALFAPALTRNDLRDLAHLKIAVLLGLLYLSLMTYIVSWYGNLPDKAQWYLARSASGWPSVLEASLIAGLLAFAVLISPMKTTRIGIRLAGFLMVPALALHWAWMIVPAFPNQGRVLLAAALCVSAVMAFAIALVSLLRGSPEASHVA